MKSLFACALVALLSACSSGDDAAPPADPDTGASQDTLQGDTATASDTTDPGTDAAATLDSAGTDTASTPDGDASVGTGKIHNVFIIVMENRNWTSIKGNKLAPYINDTLLKEGAHAEQYFNPPGLHPSEPNYIWLEAGDNLGLTGDGNPSATNHLTTTEHLVTQLEGKGVSWKSYQEDIDGTKCPLTSVKQYAPKHNPMIFFDDVTDGLKATSPKCIAHVRPYTELETDLAAGTAPHYAFLTPNLCNDMHGGTGCAANVATGDTWLSKEIPMIRASSAYKDGGVIFIVWDEAASGDGPIGMIVLSPLAKVGFAGTKHYTHSSTLKTIEEIFGVPLLRDAAQPATNDLSDLFESFP